MPKIDVLANTTSAQRSVKDLSEAFDQVGDSLEDVARDGDQAGDKLERSFKGMVQDAGRAEKAAKEVGNAAKIMAREMAAGGDRAERALEAARREAKRTEKAVEDIGDHGQAGFRKMSAAGEEATGELKQNLGETFSSFRGDIEDFGQIGQDVFGGLASSAGSLTASIGLAGVAGAVGLVIGGLIQAREEQERNAEKANEWAEAYMEAGGRILSTTTIVAKGQAILRDEMDQLKANTEAWGVSQETALAAMSGSPAAIEEVKNSLANMTAEMERQQKLEMKDEWAEYSSELTDLQGRVYKGSDAFEQMTARMDEGAAKADAYSYFLRDVATTTEGATKTVDEFGDAVVTLPDGKRIYIDAETGQATDDVDAIERKVYGIQDKTITARVIPDDSAIRAYRPPTLRVPAEVVFNNGRVAQY